MRHGRLHPVQAKLLHVLSEHSQDPLSYRDLAEAIGVGSTNTVAYHLKQLEQKGRLKRNPSDPRDYVVLGQPETGVVRLNVYGLAHCGPKGSILEGGPIDRIPVSTKLIPFAAADAFLVRAKGDSMEPRIYDGDLVVCRRQRSADDGELAVCVNAGEALIKRLKKGAQPILISLNPKYDPFVAKKDFRVEGVVKAIISQAAV